MPFAVYRYENHIERTARSMTKDNLQLQEDVIEELAFDPAVDATNIGVTAKGGVVTLTGTVGTLPQKLAAERAVKRVAGVHGIAEELTIQPPSIYHQTDAEIARAALNALEWDVSTPKNALTVKVEGGWLTLEGQVDWQFQRQAARRAVENLTGLFGVTDSITVKPRVSAADVKAKIRGAFERAAQIDADKVHIAVSNGTVTLQGNVHSWTEHDDATHAAYSFPGVTFVKNETNVV